jgi:hypothetical protein
LGVKIKIQKFAQQRSEVSPSAKRGERERERGMKGGESQSTKPDTGSLFSR